MAKLAKFERKATKPKMEEPADKMRDVECPMCGSTMGLDRDPEPFDWCEECRTALLYMGNGEGVVERAFRVFITLDKSPYNKALRGALLSFSLENQKYLQRFPQFVTDAIGRIAVKHGRKGKIL